MSLIDIWMDIRDECVINDHNWPGQIDNPATPWCAILGEEFGEVCRASLDNKNDGPQDLRKELIQVAAVAVAWVEALDRRAGT